MFFYLATFFVDIVNFGRSGTENGLKNENKEKNFQ